VVGVKVIAAAIVISVFALRVPSPTVNVYVPPVIPVGTKNHVVRTYALVPEVGTLMLLSALSMEVAPIVAAVIGYAGGVAPFEAGARPLIVMLTFPCMFAVVGVVDTDGAPNTVSVAVAVSAGTGGVPARAPSVKVKV